MAFDVLSKILRPSFARMLRPILPPLVRRKHLLCQPTIRAETRVLNEANVIAIAEVAHRHVYIVDATIEMWAHFGQKGGKMKL